jgi:hypothetical protein
MTTLEQIKQSLEEFAEKKRVLVEQLRAEFSSILAPFFEKSKLINSISWTQYTPYFNDGDECTFSCNFGDIYVNGSLPEDLDRYGWEVKHPLSGGKYAKEVQGKNWDIEEYKIVYEIQEALESIPEEFYLEMFGDHVQVTCNRDGSLLVEEYEHD